MSNSLSQAELRKIHREMEVIVKYNDLLDAETAEERGILERNLARLSVLQGQVLRSIALKAASRGLKLLRVV
jgi:hypothetical protein